MPKWLIFDAFARKMSQIMHFCGVKLLNWKSGCVKFLTNFMSVLNLPSKPNSFLMCKKSWKKCSVYSTDSLWIYLKYECTHSLWANSNEKCIWTRSRTEIKTARIQNFSSISNLYESFNIQYELKGDFMISLSGR